MATKLTKSQRAAVARRAVEGESAEKLAKEYGLTPKHVTRMAADERARRRAVAEAPESKPPATAEAAKRELLLLFLRTVATMRGELLQYEALFQAAASEGDVKALSTIELARGIHIDKLNVIAASLTAFEREVMPAKKLRVNLSRKVAS